LDDNSDVYSVADLAPFQPEEEITPFDGPSDMHDKEEPYSPVTARYVEDSSGDSAEYSETFEDAQQDLAFPGSKEMGVIPDEVIADGFVEPAPVEQNEETDVEVPQLIEPEIAGPSKPVQQEIPTNWPTDFPLLLPGGNLSRKGKYPDYDTFSIREARVVAIPPVVNARTIVTLIPTEFPLDSPSTPVSSSNPYVHVYTSRSAAVELPSPLFEPIRKHKKSQSSPLPANAMAEAPPSSTQSFTPRMMSSKPSLRPPTSYSWLGALFQPIDPDVEDAQKHGWIDGPDESVEDLPTRKLSTRLKKIFPQREQVMTEEVIFIPNFSNM